MGSLGKMEIREIREIRNWKVEEFRLPLTSAVSLFPLSNFHFAVQAKLDGVAGFEPAYDRIKICCLAA